MNINQTVCTYLKFYCAFIGLASDRETTMRICLAASWHKRSLSPQDWAGIFKYSCVDMHHCSAPSQRLHSQSSHWERGLSALIDSSRDTYFSSWARELERERARGRRIVGICWLTAFLADAQAPVIPRSMQLPLTLSVLVIRDLIIKALGWAHADLN